MFNLDTLLWPRLGQNETGGEIQTDWMPSDKLSSFRANWAGVTSVSCVSVSVPVSDACGDQICDQAGLVTVPPVTTISDNALWETWSDQADIKFGS